MPLRTDSYSTTVFLGGCYIAISNPHEASIRKHARSKQAFAKYLIRNPDFGKTDRLGRPVDLKRFEF